MSEVARRVVVRGRVQGVFFRDSTRREASRLGVAGWVRNCRDGSVEAHIEGEAGAVGALERWLGSGPSRAEVASVEAEDAVAEGHAGFAVR